DAPGRPVPLPGGTEGGDRRPERLPGTGPAARTSAPAAPGGRGQARTDPADGAVTPAQVLAEPMPRRRPRSNAAAADPRLAEPPGVRALTLGIHAPCPV